MKRLIKGVIRPFYKFFAYKVKWHGKCIVPLSAKVSAQSVFEGMSQIHPHTCFHGSLGFGSYIGAHCAVSAEVGRFTSIASRVTTISGRHPYTYPYVSTSPSFISLNPHHLQNGSTFATRQMYDESNSIDKKRGLAVRIGSDCWIGEGASIVGGVNIGDGAVVLAHAVVTKDVPPYAIVGGVPARVLKFRYDDDTIKFLMDLKWWNKGSEWLKQNWELFSDIEALKRYIKQ